MAKGKTDIARLWDYVRDDRPFGGTDPPAVVFYYSRDRRGEHVQAHLASWSGILQADAFAGYSDLYAPTRQPGLILEAGCFAHARRKFFEVADVEGAARKKSRGEKAGIIYAQTHSPSFSAVNCCASRAISRLKTANRLSMRISALRSMADLRAGSRC